jgi:hypothetical protein
MTDYTRAEETYRMYRYDRDNGHDQYIRSAEVAQRYYASEQWSPEDRMSRKAQRRPTVTVNELFETINSIEGEMAQLSTDVRYQAETGDEQTADALNKLSLHVDRSNKLYVHDTIVRRDGMLTGRGYYEIRMDFDENMQGNVSIKSRRPQNVILPADIESVDTKEWTRVTTTEILSLNDIEELYGKERANDMKGMPLAAWYEVEDRNLAQSLGYNQIYHSGELTLDMANPYVKQYRQLSMQYVELKEKDFFVSLDTGDMAEIPENWEREKIQYALDNLGLGTLRRKAKTIRWRVVVNDQVVHDEDSPYKFFTIVPYLPYFIDGQTLSLFDVLRGPQDLLNKALSEEIHILSSVAASGWKVKRGSLTNHTPRELEQKGAENGLVLVLEDTDDAQKIEPSTPPAGFEGLSARAQNWVKGLAGLTPSMQGQQRADASGEGIRLQLLRAPVNLSMPLQAFHHTKHMLAERKLNLFQTFYTETRVVRVVSGTYGQSETVGVNMPYGDRIVNDLTMGTYSVQILPSGSRMQAEEYAFDELVKLKELGVQVPNDLLISVSAINAKADAVQRLREANSGDLSPEEQRARELELEQMEMEVAAARADVENKHAQTQLAYGRAKRAEADAQTPAARIALDANRQRLEAERDARNASQQSDKQSSDVALKLTEMEQQQIIEREKTEQAKAQAKVAAPRKQPR